MSEGLRKKLRDALMKFCVINTYSNNNGVQSRVPAMDYDRTLDAIISVVVAEIEAVPKHYEAKIANGLEKSAWHFRYELLSRLKGEEK